MVWVLDVHLGIHLNFLLPIMHFFYENKLPIHILSPLPDVAPNSSHLRLAHHSSDYKNDWQKEQNVQQTGFANDRSLGY